MNVNVLKKWWQRLIRTHMDSLLRVNTHMQHYVYSNVISISKDICMVIRRVIRMWKSLHGVIDTAKSKNFKPRQCARFQNFVPCTSYLSSRQWRSGAEKKQLCLHCTSTYVKHHLVLENYCVYISSSGPSNVDWTIRRNIHYVHFM